MFASASSGFLAQVEHGVFFPFGRVAKATLTPSNCKALLPLRVIFSEKESFSFNTLFYYLARSAAVVRREQGTVDEDKRK